MDRPISISEKKKDRELALAADRRRLLQATPEEALDIVADHPYPVTLVQSFSEEDLYFLVHAIGPEDALPILALASNEQWEYLLDLEVWQADRPDNQALTRWLDRLLKADGDRFTRWIIYEQNDLLTYYLGRNVELFIREYEVDPSEVAEGFFTEDDTHYVRLRPTPSTDPSEPAPDGERDTFVMDLLKRLSVYDYMVYQGVLLRSSAVIPAESEEELLRLRTVRLAEKGFLPLEEAIGVYQPLTVADLMRRRRKTGVFSGRPIESFPLRVEQSHLSQAGDIFSRSLAQLQDPAAFERLQSEFAGLCNQLVAADQRPVREKNDLARVVEKVRGYIALGIEKVISEAVEHDPHAGPNLIQNHFLADLFRVGYGCALSLKWKAERWRPRSWAAKAGLPLSFWGEAWVGVLGGVLLKKPLFYDNYANGRLYREFATLTDIHLTEHILEAIIAMDELLAQMALEPSILPKTGGLTYANLVLTLWAEQCVGVPQDPTHWKALTFSQFRRFFDQLWETPEIPRKINDAMRESFLSWLAGRSGRPDHEISERLGTSLEQLFQQIETELGAVAVKDLDPRFIPLFLFSADAADRSQLKP